ncbi:MAG: TPM domain-containing protein [Bacteroidales bacterium]|nr:TPM domain-containing protein [Bacteroidales bacterium]
MKEILNDTDRTVLDRRIDEAEKRTRAQIVLAIIEKCDSYAEIPWKAFATGISLSGFIVFLVYIFRITWITDTMIIFSIALILLTGALFVLFTVLFPGFARLYLSENRKETEIHQYAESLFLSKELFATKGRRGILLLVSRFERQVVILPDKGVRDRLSTDTMKGIISKMTVYLRKNEIKKAMETGLDEVIKAICPPLSGMPDTNELSNEIIREEDK